MEWTPAHVLASFLLPIEWSFAEYDDVVEAMKERPDRFTKWQGYCEQDIPNKVKTNRQMAADWYSFRSYWDGEKPDIVLREELCLKTTLDGMQRLFDGREQYVRENAGRLGCLQFFV